MPLVPLASQGRRGVFTPDICALNQLFSQEQIVVTRKTTLYTYFRAVRKLGPLPNHPLTFEVLWMRFSSEYDLHRMFPIGQDVYKPLRITQQKVGTFRRNAKRRAKPRVSVLLSRICEACESSSEEAPVSRQLSDMQLANVMH